MKLPSFVWKFIGKKVVGDNVVKWEISKAKLTAIIYVIVTAINTLGPALGHPITIPDWVFRLLEGAGLWAVRDALKS